MMLVQKQPNLNLTPVVHPHHRRNPSAPAAVLVVQPTKIPGVLSISRPQRTTPQRQMVPQQRQQAPRTAPKPRAPVQQSPAQSSPKKPADLAASTPNNRGRAHKQPKDKKRLSTPSPVRSRHTRQPSPPAEAQTQSLQAEEQTTSHNQFDPFLESSTSTSPALSKSIPVPSKVVRPQLTKMSRSAPKPSNMAPRPPRTFNFPICDDDLSEPDSAGVPTPPATPMRRNTFEGKGSPDAGAANKVRRHRRAPSEGVFAMSSDDELSSESVSPMLFGLSRPKRPPVTPAPSFTRIGGLAAAKELNGSPASSQKGAGFFASSVFQNSPSPDELPNPLLF
ncbi:hypothetical protein BKA70DRAFT_1416106 [Coprinopsis sp. MPI-PUGE-AT-0042]|nr:hypothetical protein BKA70DRAFT_1416106 [Coprinopsis sp. MPI-PUGE-AT-0042]